MSDEDVQPLSIGSIVGGPTSANAGWRQAIRELTERIVRARVGVQSPVNVNIVFHVPGNIVQPDYSGVRTGSYSKRDRLLLVQAALPEALEGDALEHVRSVADAALGEAETWFRRKGLADDLTSLREVLART